MKLSEAAAQLGCHIETLRLRVRRGELPARRGPHGTYYIANSVLVGLAPPLRPGRRELDLDLLEWTWDGLAQRAEDLGAGDHELELIDRIRWQPELSPELHRLLTVQRLRLAGVSSGQIAGLVGVSDRQVRRLSRRRLVDALEDAGERLRRRAQVAELTRARRLVRELERRLEEAGLASHRRRRRRGDWGTPPGGRVRAFRVWKIDAEMARHLRAVGVSDEQMEAIRLVGIGADEVNALLLAGLRQGPGD
ncbi:MAG TPA: hypothetical protein VF137_03335 [Candidatus Dormibacteraeota bacterium]